MRFSKVKALLVLIRVNLIILMLSSNSFAVSKSLTNKEYSQVVIEQFEIRPLTCVTQMLGQICELKIKLHWRTNTKADFCVYQEERLIRCWHNAQQGQHKETLNITKNTRFSLQPKGIKVVLAKRDININYVESDIYRRRLRSQWSIF